MTLNDKKQLAAALWGLPLVGSRHDSDKQTGYYSQNNVSTPTCLIPFPELGLPP